MSVRIRFIELLCPAGGGLPCAVRHISGCARSIRYRRTGTVWPGDLPFSRAVRHRCIAFFLFRFTGCIQQENNDKYNDNNNTFHDRLSFCFSDMIITKLPPIINELRKK